MAWGLYEHQFYATFLTAISLRLHLVILINFLRVRRVMKRYGAMGIIKDMFGSLSTDSNQYSRVKYYCISCGKEHNDVACPSCGSKMKRVG